MCCSTALASRHYVHGESIIVPGMDVVAFWVMQVTLQWGSMPSKASDPQVG